MLMGGDRTVEVVAGYRTHAEAMQVVSGSTLKPTVHFEAPPSRSVPREMKAFVEWFNGSAPDGRRPCQA